MTIRNQGISLRSGDDLELNTCFFQRSAKPKISQGTNKLFDCLPSAPLLFRRRPNPKDPNAVEKKSKRKRLRVNSSTSTEDSKNDAIVELTASEFQRIMSRVAKIEEESKHQEARITQLEKELLLAKEEIKALKSTSQQLESSLEFTQKDQEEALERINECE